MAAFTPPRTNWTDTDLPDPDDLNTQVAASEHNREDLVFSGNLVKGYTPGGAVFTLAGGGTANAVTVHAMRVTLPKDYQLIIRQANFGIAGVATLRFRIYSATTAAAWEPVHTTFDQLDPAYVFAQNTSGTDSSIVIALQVYNDDTAGAAVLFSTSWSVKLGVEPI